MTETVFTRRCNAQERKAFERSRSHDDRALRQTEPVLGTLDERLDIIIRRHGGRTRPATMSKRERQECAAWCRDQGVPNPLDEQ